MTVSAWRLMIAAFVAGAAGDVLLRGDVQWRQGFSLWITLIAASALVLDHHLPRERALLLAGLVAAAFGLVLRDANLLYGVDFGSLLVMGALVIWHGSGRTLGELTVVEGARAFLLGAANTIGGAADVLRRAGTERAQGAGDPGRARALLVGVVLAVPPLAVVAALLSASDQVFRQVLDRITDVFAITSLNHVLIIALLSWFAAGWLRSATGATLGASVRAPASPGLRFATVAVPVYSLVALLALFLATQARVLFGGEAFLRSQEGLTVANYAREGFFQLILAAFIVLVTLVMAEWLMAAGDAAARRHFNRAGGVLLALVTTLLASAAVRIGIYMTLFGHSMDRMFASAAIVWVLLALVTCALTTLRGQAQRFAPAMVGVSIGWVAVLNVMNPEAMVVRANVARAVAGASFDVPYHAHLSADAVPVLLELAPQLHQAECRQLGMQLHDRWLAPGHSTDSAHRDWRGQSIPLTRVSRWLVHGAPLDCSRAPL